MHSVVSWLPTFFWWYLLVGIIGLVVLPLNSWLFQRFVHRGYPLAKILGFLLTCYLIYLSNFLRLLPFQQWTIWLTLVILASGNYWLWKRKRIKLPPLSAIIGYELLFLVMLGLWSYIKGFEPTIQSLEKYMDFGFIQTIINTPHFPPPDMWFASTANQLLPINYYYYGHFSAALLIKLTGVIPAAGYNLMLATIFAWATTASFAIGSNLYLLLTKEAHLNKRAIVAGILALLLVNFGGNLHTIYVFTKGYSPEQPVPFWEILSQFNPTQYWYPNATRFIPFTIHEFPSYSYVVSDLHGHVLDIPFVLFGFSVVMLIATSRTRKRTLAYLTLYSLILATNYMTNSTDFLVYGSLLFFVLVIRFDNLFRVLLIQALVGITALILTLPFSSHFKPFASALGVNCAPLFLTKIGHLGPLLFEADKCQSSPFWMLAILWGLFWITFVIFLKSIFFTKEGYSKRDRARFFFFFVYVVGILLTLFAEFFYFKDIYPAHFRANTMFKLGYQAFIMLSLLSSATIIYSLQKAGRYLRVVYLLVLTPVLALVLSYYHFAVPSYFGHAGFQTLDGSSWIKTKYPDTYQMIQILDRAKQKQGLFNIIEAHGDSYTDYDVVSAHTGLPTIIGWPVHEWLWRGSYDIVAPRVEEVRLVYEGGQESLAKIKKIINKYQIRYIVIGQLEYQKYPKLKLNKFYKIGAVVYKNLATNSYLFRIND